MLALFFYRRIERTTLIGLWCAAILCGVALAATPLRVEGIAWLLISGLGLLLSAKRTWGAVILVVLSGLSIGLWRGSLEQYRFASLESNIGKEVSILGTVASDPELNKTGSRLNLRLSSIMINGKDHTGTVSVTAPADTVVARGDKVTASGKLSRGFGGTQARISYTKTLVVQPSYAIEIQARDSFAASVRNSVAEPEASLGLGFLLGQRSALPNDLEENFKLLGLTHIVVASGYNLTVLVRLARRLLEKVSKFQATSVSLALVAGFVTVTGFSSSMTRAALVTVLAVWAWHYGRKIHPLLLLLFAAAITVLWNPFYVWSDVGWYLSFLAFAGVLLLAPLVTYRLYGEQRPPLAIQLCIETISAQVATLPLILYLFGSLPVLSVLANVLVVPFIPLVMLLTFLAGLGGLMTPVLGIVFALPAGLLLSYIVTISGFLSTITWASLAMPISVGIMLASYAAIVSAGLIIWQRTKYDFLQRSFIE